MKTGTESIEGLRCELGMIGIPTDGQCNVNRSMPTAGQLRGTARVHPKEEVEFDCFHCVWECGSARIVGVQCETVDTNHADMLTEIQSGS